jgi:hypothetical protein
MSTYTTLWACLVTFVKATMRQPLSMYMKPNHFHQQLCHCFQNNAAKVDYLGLSCVSNYSFSILKLYYLRNSLIYTNLLLCAVTHTVSTDDCLSVYNVRLSRNWRPRVNIPHSFIQKSLKILFDYLCCCMATNVIYTVKVGDYIWFIS